MKTLFQFLAVLTVLAFSSAPSLVRAQDVPPPPDQGSPPPGDQDQGDQGDQSDQGASFQTFYDQLGAQGNWVQTDDYGYVFQPNVSDPDWAPYTDGHWVYTDMGWTWVSDEPWGWATYHYGRWANIDGFGWVWVPGYRWAPAWVSWRYGGGYCGWAPLPPGTFLGAEYGGSGGWASFHFGGDVDVSFGIGAGCYNFVSVGDMGEPNYRGHYLDRSRNYTVINNTTNITNINVSRNGGATGNFRGVAVGGPPISQVNAHSRQHIPTVQLTAANQAGGGNLQGNSLAVYAPRMNPASVHTARPATVSQTIAHPTFNRGDSITKPLAVSATVRPAAPSAAAIQAAQTAQLHAPAKAKIATVKTTVKTPLTAPLTSLAPVAQVHRTTNAATPGANAFNPNTEHSAASAPFTGEPVNKPSVAQPNEDKPATTYHPENRVYPQTEAKPAATYPPENVFKPQAQVQQQAQEQQQAQAQQQERQQQQQQAQPQQQERQQQQVQPQQQEHQQQQQAQPQQQEHHQQQAPAPSGQGNKPAASGSNNNAPNNKNKQQGQ